MSRETETPQKRAEELEEEIEALKQEARTRESRIAGLQEKERQLGEREKELLCIYRISEFIETPGLTLPQFLQGIAERLPAAWQHPEITGARITLDGREFRTDNFRETEWKLSRDIVIRGRREGVLEIGCIEERPEEDEGPFLKEKRQLINSIADRLGRMIERLRSDSKLQEREKQYRDLYENAPIAYYSVGKNGRIIRCNRRAARLLGYGREELVGKPIFDLYADSDHGKKKASEIFKRYLSGESILDEELQMQRKDGRLLWISLTVTVVRDTSGGIMESRSMVVDITDRKRIEEAVQLSESKYRAITDHASEGICVLQDGLVRFINPFALTTSGYREEDIINKPILDFVHPDDHRTADENYPGRLAGGEIQKDYEIRFIKKDGGIMWVSINGVLIDWQEAPASLIFLKDVTEQRKAAQALRESEERYRLHFQSISDVIYSLSPDLKVLSVSPSVESLLGYRPEELVGKDLPDISGILTAPSMGKAMSDIARVLEGEVVSSSEYEFIARDGSVKSGEVSGTPLITDGRITAVLSVARDITGRKRAEEALRESEKRFRTLATNLPGAVYQFYARDNGDMGLYYVSERSRDLLGLDNRIEDFFSRFTACVAPEDRDRFLESIGEAVRTGSRWDFEGRFIRPGGEEMYFRGVSQPEKRERELVFYGVLLDITDRKRAEKALQESEEKYRILVESANEAIFIAQDGVLKFANPITEALTGYSAREMASMPFTAHIHPEDRARVMETHMKRLRGESVPRSYSFRVIDRKGKESWVDLNAVLVQWEGRPATLNFIRDITFQKNVEALLLRSRKMEAIGTLAGGIAHDFNNILMGIQGHASLMMLTLEPGHPCQDRLRNIQDMVVSGANLSKQLLGFARAGRYEVRPTDLNEVIRKTADIFGRTKKEIFIRMRYEPGLWTVDVDRGQIEQVLMNLFVNAWQAMPDGGTLDLETRNMVLEEDFTTPQNALPGRYAMISVADSGMGMDAKTRERIFEPFFTTKEMGRGTGLGLATVYGIIRGHKGLITVSSEKGKGSTFEIYLPASGAEITEKKEMKEERHPGRETVLVVDDEEMVLEVTKEMLVSLGYRVITARDGSEAVEVFRLRSGEIDLVILDMIMPGMGGGETFDGLKAFNPEIRVILSSGYSIDGQAQTILDRGCRAFIQKPFTIEALSRKVRESLDQANRT